MMCLNNQVLHALKVFLSLHIALPFHIIMQFISMHWIYKMHVSYILLNYMKMKSILSIKSMQYIVYFQLTHFSCADCKSVYYI